MIDGAIRAVAVLASLVIVTGFVLFAVDELSSASRDTQAQLVDPDATQEARREQANSGPREVIDDANDFLLSPFAGIVDTNSLWAQRVITLLLGLLVYGLGLGFLANWVRRA